MVKLYGLFDGHKYENDQALADKLGYELKTLQKHFPIWRTSGFVRKTKAGIQLWPFEDGSELPEIETRDLSVSEEIAEQPKRKHEMSQKEAWELIKEGWNDNMPEHYTSLSGAVNTPLYIAIETHAVKLQIERENYGEFVGAVLRGLENWWKEEGRAGMKATNVFGFGANIDAKKFTNVEKAYKVGKTTELKAQPKDLGDEWYLEQVQAMWPEWSKRKCPYKRVVRMTFESAEQAKLVANGPNLAAGIKRGTHNLEHNDVRVQYEALKKLHMGPSGLPEWYNEEVLGLAFTAEYDFPLYWTSADKLPRN
ncbi:DNA replication protein [Synechococcus phage S-CRES3]|nr:DNA replication protein [Synechococcus phage S-CRES3]